MAASNLINTHLTVFFSKCFGVPFRISTMEPYGKKYPNRGRSQPGHRGLKSDVY